MPLSEHVCCVAVIFKMTEQVPANLHQILRWAWTFLCSNYSDDLEAAAMGNWWLAASSHLVQNFFVKHKITQVTQSPYSPYLVLPCKFWLFPKLNLPLKGTRFQTVDEIQENTMGQLMGVGRTVWGPKVPTLKGTEVLLSYVQCFMYLFQ